MIAAPGPAMLAVSDSAINVESGIVAAAVSHYKSILLSLFTVIACIKGTLF